MEGLPKDLVAASATPLILSILGQGDSYGYGIIQKVRELSAGQMQWADGMLYPILHRLQKRGLIEAYWGKADTGRKRKYYRLLDAGQQSLNEQRQIWNKINVMLGNGDVYV
ncbi:MAG: PadR family transcriptional regulator [Lysobacteraceae bacterium]|nr:MAG: PadR family transcriptional regulator [Xanthomonadaceae bacterium]